MSEIGMKHDAGKAPIARGFTRYFPRAIASVADISLFGFIKYKEWGGWRKVPDAFNRYDDGHGRHDNALQRGETHCPESKKLHLAHRAWNALATLELYLIEEETKRALATLEQESKDQSWADAANEDHKASEQALKASTFELLKPTDLETKLYGITPIETCDDCKCKYDCQRSGVCFNPPKEFKTCGRCKTDTECQNRGYCLA